MKTLTFRQKEITVGRPLRRFFHVILFAGIFALLSLLFNAGAIAEAGGGDSVVPSTQAEKGQTVDRSQVTTTAIPNCVGGTTDVPSANIQPGQAILLHGNSGSATDQTVPACLSDGGAPGRWVFCVDFGKSGCVDQGDANYHTAQTSAAHVDALEQARINWLFDQEGTLWHLNIESERTALQTAMWEVLGQVTPCNSLCSQAEAAVPAAPPVTPPLDFWLPSDSQCQGFVSMQTGSIGDLVWYDLDSNGIQNGSESGIPGVTVWLKDSGGNILDTAVTDSNGLYLFSKLDAGTYTVEINVSTLPANLTQTFDLDGILDHQTTVSLAYAQNRVDVDFGYLPFEFSASIGDKVWKDQNSNGIQDSGEAGVDDLSVFLYKVGSLDSRYDFGNGPLAASYTAVSANTVYNSGSGFGWQDSAQRLDVDRGAPDDLRRDLVVSSNNATMMFAHDMFDGVYAVKVIVGDENAAVSDTKLSFEGMAPRSVSTTAGNFADEWFTVEVLDGQLNLKISGSGQPGINALEIYGLVYCSDTVTANGGLYSFDNLDPDKDYVVQFIPMSSMPLTEQDAGTNDALDSDPNPSTGYSNPIFVNPGDNDDSIDAGVLPDGIAIGNIVWSDDNSDSLSFGESGIADVIVELYDAGSTPCVDSLIAKTKTDANGNYIFFAPPGTYRVAVVQSSVPISFTGSSLGGNHNPDTTGDDDAPNGDDGTSGGAGCIVTQTFTASVLGQSDTSDSGDPFGLPDASSYMTIDFGFVQGGATAINLGEMGLNMSGNAGILTIAAASFITLALLSMMALRKRKVTAK